MAHQWRDDLAWWKQEQPHTTITAIVDDLDQRQSWRRAAHIQFLRLYGDRSVANHSRRGSLSLVRQSRAASLQEAYDGINRPKVSINVVRNMCDAAVSMVTKNRPKTSFTSAGGDWEKQRRAQMRERFVDGLFNEERVYERAQRICQDASILGTGALYVSHAHGKVLFERCYPGELLVDEHEAVYGTPRNLYRVRVVDRGVLGTRYPAKAKEIADAKQPDERWFSNDLTSDMVLVIEAWHLPSGPDAGDGRYVMCTDSAALVDEEWTHDRFPFAFFRWNDEPLGFWGTGIAHQLTGLQYEINQLVRYVQAQMASATGVKVLVERGSKIAKAHINNDLRGTVVEYTGAPPQWYTPQSVSGEVLKHLQWLISQAYQVTGISELSASSRVPSGLDSGRAMLVYNNIETARFQTTGRNWETFFRDVAELSLLMAGECAEAGGDYKVLYRDSTGLRPISYDEIKLDPGDYETQVYPTSQLPNTPAGRLAFLKELTEAGFISQEKAWRALEFRDIEDDADREMAPENLVRMRVDRILYEGEYLPPHPRMNVAFAVEYATNRYQWAELNGFPDERLELLGEFIDMANAILDDAAAAAAPPAPMPGAGAPAPGAMPPPAMPPGVPPMN